VDLISEGEVDLIVNTPFGNSGQRLDGYEIRTAAVMRGIPCLTTVQALGAAVQGIEALRGGEVGVAPLQRHHGLIVGARRAQPVATQEARGDA
jgi:carbamoyl-phosphate synthase large subunit